MPAVCLSISVLRAWSCFKAAKIKLLRREASAFGLPAGISFDPWNSLVCLWAFGQSHALWVGESKRTNSWGCPISSCAVPLQAICFLLFLDPASLWEPEQQLWGETQQDTFSDACSVSSLGLVMIGVIIGARKVGINPDNVATPIAASLGDLITLSLLAGISSTLFKYIGTVFSRDLQLSKGGINPCEIIAGRLPISGISEWRLSCHCGRKMTKEVFSSFSFSSKLEGRA